MKKKVIIGVCIAVLVIIIGAFAWIKLNNTFDKSNPVIFEKESNDDYSYIIYQGREYVPYCAVSPNEREKYLGYVGYDKQDEIYTFKGYTEEEWLISYLNSGLMNDCMLLKEKNVRNIPDELSSEYEWNNIDNANAVINETSKNNKESSKTRELTPEMQELKTKIEQDEAGYGNDYKTFDYCKNTYKRKPDRIYFKDPDKNGFFVFEKEDEDFEHLLEVTEDRMAYTVMEDYNLYSFTPDSINTMMTSKDTYIIFYYDNGDLSEFDSNYNKDIIFRFNQNTRLYRLVTYLSYFKELISREDLDKKEFATNTSITGFKYMMYGDFMD